MNCYDECKMRKQKCLVEDCRLWIDYAEDLNCTHIAVQKNGDMCLREIGERLNLTPSRIKQIENGAVAKVTKRFRTLNIL